MKMVGIIFSNIYDQALGDLTKHRTLASLPFGGRYRLIDFILSNMANSNMETIGIITKYNYQSLMDHLGSCGEWDLNRKNGRVFILPPFGTGQTSVYQGKLEALQGALPYLKKAKGSHVLLSGSHILCNIDYENVLKSHVKSGAKVTAVANRSCTSEITGGEIEELILTEKDGIATDIAISHKYEKSDLISMGMYILDKQYLISIVEDSVAHGFFHFEKDFLQKYFMDKEIDINVYEFKKTVLRNTDIPSYFANHQKLLDASVRNDIFDSQNPIYTKVRDEVPSFYDENAIVNNCLLADGCRIMGTVENSVLSRNVIVEAGAVVKNSIIMQGTVVHSGANIEYAIIDKDATITEDRTLVGAATAPIIIQKGEKI